jgi:hypothetical protein
LPEFRPNEYLFSTHKDKGKERWEIFAWAVRDVMLRAGDFKECNYSIKTKFKYENYMNQKPGALMPTSDALEQELQQFTPSTLNQPE